jgi:hypothetical protein
VEVTEVAGRRVLRQMKEAEEMEEAERECKKGQAT